MNKTEAMKLASKKSRESGGIYHVIIDGYCTLSEKWLPLYDVVSESYAMNEDCNVVETFNP